MYSNVHQTWKISQNLRQSLTSLKNGAYLTWLICHWELLIITWQHHHLYRLHHLVPMPLPMPLTIRYSNNTMNGQSHMCQITNSIKSFLSSSNSTLSFLSLSAACAIQPFNYTHFNTLQFQAALCKLIIQDPNNLLCCICYKFQSIRIFFMVIFYDPVSKSIDVLCLCPSEVLTHEQ